MRIIRSHALDVLCDDKVCACRKCCIWSETETDAVLQSPSSQIDGFAAPVIKLQVFVITFSRDWVIHDFVYNNLSLADRSVCRARSQGDKGSDHRRAVRKSPHGNPIGLVP